MPLFDYGLYSDNVPQYSNENLKPLESQILTESDHNKKIDGFVSQLSSKESVPQLSAVNQYVGGQVHYLLINSLQYTNTTEQEGLAIEKNLASASL